MRDQDELRQSAPVVSAPTVFAAASSVGLAGLAAVASVLPVWGSVLLPALTSGIFIYSSIAESSGSRSKGLARCSSAEALGLASQQEGVLAQAEQKKAFLPFGVGLTAIFAAGCVTLKLLEEEVGGVIPWALPAAVTRPLEITGDDVLVFVFSLWSVVGAVVASDRCLLMQAALTLAPKDQRDESLSEWEAGRLPSIARDPAPALRFLAAGLSVLICLLPSSLLVTATSGPGWIEQATVVISATAAAWSAVVLVVAERDFADAERRIAIQSKQAALAELFFAQVEAEAATMPVATAVSGAALGGATLAVEFSSAAAAAFAWPAVASTVLSSVGAVMARLEAAAAHSELQTSRKGRGNRKQSDAVSSSLRELSRLQTELGFSQLSDQVRESLQSLPPGEVREFKMPSRQDRRQVHLIAAELGMESQSSGSATERVVRVANFGMSQQGLESKADDVKGAWAELQEEVRGALARGVPACSRPAAALAAAAVLGSLAAPLLLVRGAAELVVPLATSGVGLGTVWQETAGKEVVASAKRRTASLLNLQSKAELLIGRALMCYGALPTAFAVANLFMTLAIAGFASASCPWVPYVVAPATPLACVTCSMAWRRCKRVERYVTMAVRSLGGDRPTPRLATARHWWLAPIALAMLVPCHNSRRLAIACALFVAEIGLLMAVAARHIAWGQYHTARCGISSATADAWSQQAQVAVRRLPVESAIAIAGTLLSTAVVTFSLPASLLFPLLSFPNFVRAVQLRAEAQESAARVRSACSAPPQELPRSWPWAGAPRTEASVGALLAAGPGAETLMGELGPSPSTPAALQLQPAGRGWESLWLGRAAAALRAAWDGRPFEEEYGVSPAQRVVENLQADLDEVRLSMRANERNWFRMFSIVALVATGAILMPFVLPEIVTEVGLPVAGTALTVFAATTESAARRDVATAKVRSAELCAAVAHTQELLATATLIRSRLIGAAGLSCAGAAISLVLEHPLIFRPDFQCVQTGVQVLLMTAQIILSAWCARPLREVLRLAHEVRGITADALRGSLPRRTSLSPGRCRGTRWELLAVLPPLLLAFLPRGRSLAQRAVVSGAAAGFVLAAVLLLAEGAFARAELATARRARAYALTDAFTNEAEQQGALLPLASAATIGVAGLITFGTELNPYAASALVLLQVATWVLASRKAVATKFETTAAMEVNSVMERGSPQLGDAGGPQHQASGRGQS